VADLSIGILCSLGSASTWALICILAQALAERFSAAGINGFRALMGGVVVFAGALAFGYGGEIVGMPLWVALALWGSALIGYLGGDVVFFLGMQQLGVTRAHTLSMVHPLVTALAGMLLFGEAMTALRGSGILLVVGGIALIVTGKQEGGAESPHRERRGVGLVLLAALAWSVSSLMLKPPLQIVSPVSATAIRSPLVGIVLLCTPWARGTWKAACSVRGRAAGALAVVCLLSAISPVLYTFGIKYGGVAIGSVLSTTAPLFTIPLEVLILGIRPSRRTIVGALITVAGIALMG
jgi:drug/metabolite transporter (DMT)-like permease